MRVAATLVALVAAATCLTGGKEVQDRKNLTHPQGDGMYNGPLIDSAPWWASAQVIHGMAKILFTEVLGYTYENRYGVPSSVMFVLGPSGCKEMNKVNEACATGVAGEDYDEWAPKIHYGLEGWGSAMGAYASIPPERRATMLTKHAYRGVEAIFIRGTVDDAAYAQDNLILSTYKGWNVTAFPKLLNHFPSLGTALPIFDAAEVVKRPLESTPSAVSHANYEGATGDAGVGACYDSATNVQTNDKAEKCMGDWWISPTCRADPLKCIPLITSGGWGEAEFRQWAAFYDMPLAITDTNWGSYLAGIRGANVAFYWWYPDATFAAITPKLISVPAWNINEYSQGIYQTSMPEADLTRFVWHHMPKADEGRGKNIVFVLNRMAVYQADIDYFMDQFGLGRGGEDIACEFLQNNKHRWDGWIPNLDECIVGEGWEDGKDGEAGKCVKCEAGTVSTMNTTILNRKCLECEAGTYCPFGSTQPTPCDKGSMCPTARASNQVKCPHGSDQNQVGQTSCNLCKAGHYSDTQGMVDCDPCAVGFFVATEGAIACDRCSARLYQDTLGQADCKECKPEFTSPPGSADLNDCVCPVNTFYSESVDKCLECQLGAQCMMGRQVPFVEAGFYAEAKSSAWEGQYKYDAKGVWVWTSNPDDKTSDTTEFFKDLKVWRCPYGEAACPGRAGLKTADGFEADNARLVDECFGLLFKNGCSRCPEKYYYNNEDTICLECTGGDNALYPLIYIAGLCVMFTLYKVTKYHGSQKLTNMLMFSCSASLLINFFQMLGIIGFYQVKFPALLTGFFDFFKLFAFDLDVLRASCATGSAFEARFLTRTVSPLIFMFTFIMLYPISVVLAKVLGKEPMDKRNVLNTAGLITNAGYIALCKVSMQYYECRHQPSAEKTVAAYPDVDCNSDEHAALMPVAVIMTMLYGAGIYLMSLYLCWIAPTRMVQSQDFRRTTRFLVGRWNPGRWYWGPVLQTRNLLVSLVAVGYPSDGVMQLVVTGAIVVIYTCAQSTMEPWRDLFLNVTDTILGLAITLTCMFGVLLVADVGATETRAFNASGYLTFIFAASFASLGYAIMKACLSLVWPERSRAQDRKYTVQATKVLLLQTKRLYQLCNDGTDEDDMAEAIGTYLTISEQKAIFKLGKVLLHEMCGLKYKSEHDFKRLMINKIDDQVDIEKLLDGTAGDAATVQKPSRISALSRLGGR